MTNSQSKPSPKNAQKAKKVVERSVRTTKAGKIDPNGFGKDAKEVATSITDYGKFLA